MINNPEKIDKTIIKFEQMCDQHNGNIRRLIGFVKAKYLIGLIGITNLTANPRSAKAGKVTDAIIESIENTEDIFPFKTKGILIAASAPPKELERKRFELEFHDNEDILDGGHNTLAIALHILKKATDNDGTIKGIKNWTAFKEIWDKYKDKIIEIRQSLNFLVPVEVLVPINGSEEVMSQFRQPILDICAARNNNVQLKQDTKANAAGHYESIKKIIDPKLRNEVIWKTGTQGNIPVGSLISLAWISLRELELPVKISKITPVQIYSSKTKCVEVFVNLMEHKDVSNLVKGKYELKNPSIGSALHLLKDLPRLYDLIYKNLPSAYNSAGGKYAGISAVKNDTKKKKTPFYGEKVKENVPDGFMTPLIYGLSALMEVVGGKVRWKVKDIDKFVLDNLPKVLVQYRGIIEICGHDPQKVGKNRVSYEVVQEKFKNCL